MFKAREASGSGATGLASGFTWLRPGRRRLRTTAACALAFVWLAVPWSGAWGQSLEYPVKAAFLYKFGAFVEWPPAALDASPSPFVLCVVGDDPFGPALDQAVAGQHVGRHPVTVRRMARIDRGAPACHVLYAAGSKAQPAAQVLAAVQGEPILTVTDETHGDGSHGVVHFVLQSSRFRFEIDAHAASQNGLSISSKLLSLAVSVRPNTEGAS